MSVTRQQKLRVARWVHKWRRRLLLHAWSVHVEFSEVPRSDEPEVRADVSTRPRYSEMYITLYPVFWTFPECDQQITLIHEMAHSLTDRLMELALRKTVTQKDANAAAELLTEHIAKVLWDAYE